MHGTIYPGLPGWLIGVILAGGIIVGFIVSSEINNNKKKKR